MQNIYIIASKQCAAPTFLKSFVYLQQPLVPFGVGFSDVSQFNQERLN